MNTSKKNEKDFEVTLEQTSIVLRPSIDSVESNLIINCENDPDVNNSSYKKHNVKINAKIDDCV